MADGIFWIISTNAIKLKKFFGLLFGKLCRFVKHKLRTSMVNDFNPYMAEAIRLATENVRSGKGGPFAAVVVKNNEIIATGVNQVTSTNDPTAHAEVTAIRNACEKLNSYQLEDCDLYTSCEPCPMCLGAIYWARPNRVFYGNTKTDAADIGFDDSFIYEEIDTPIALRKIKMQQIMSREAKESFEAWANKTDKIEY
jgi:guanine deaminase